MIWQMIILWRDMPARWRFAKAAQIANAETAQEYLRLLKKR